MTPRSKRILVVHKEWGVFLGGDAAGRLYFSRMGSNGLTLATTFSSDEKVRYFLNTRMTAMPLEEFDLVPVETHGAEHVGVLEIARAGVSVEACGDMLANMDVVGNA